MFVWGWLEVRFWLPASILHASLCSGYDGGVRLTNITSRADGAILDLGTGLVSSAAFRDS